MNVAVFLPNWVGDAVMATPALRALRHHFAGARIVGVIKLYVASVFDGGDWFDELLLADADRWARGIVATAWQLRQSRIDLAVLFPNSFRSALIAWLGRCRRRVGYARYGRSPLLTHRLQPIRDQYGNRIPSPAIDGYNALAEHVGCPRPGYRMEMFTTPRDEAAAGAVWHQAGLSQYREVICLNPGAAFGSAKHWPSDSFVTLARALADRRGSGVLVLCGPAEREMARHIALRAGRPGVHSLADQPLSLGLTKACIKRANLLVTTDSGPRHFGVAFDRPVVTLFGPTHIAWTETYHAKSVHLQKQVECGPCQRRVCPLDHRCMIQLGPEEVYRTVVESLERWAPEKSRRVG
jgi:heptosyltransferase-2